jgi:hypothetical protein
MREDEDEKVKKMREDERKTREMRVFGRKCDEKNRGMWEKKTKENKFH